MDYFQYFFEQDPIGAIAIAATTVGLGMAARLSWSVFYSGSSMFAPVIQTIARSDAVALTFDDGPTDPFTNQILDVLSRHEARASFFLIGRHGTANKDVVRRMAAQGHTIGNHTWDHHRNGILGSSAYWKNQVQKTSALIEEITGLKPALFRAPMGFKTPSQVQAVQINGARYVAWRLRAWDTIELGAKSIVRHIGSKVRGGDIVTMHDGLEPARAKGSQSQTVRALPDILKRIKDRGLRCLSLEEALDFPVYQTADGSGIASRA
jgi:peptidoglycan-N-acetylglucosamine deacetylase